MRAERLKRFFVQTLPVLALVALLFSSLYLMADATSDSARFDRRYLWLLGLNAAALLVLIVAIGTRLLRLARDLRRGTPGSRLSARLVAIFLALALPPMIVVFAFALHALHRSVDSWFDVAMERALQDALGISQLFLDQRKRDSLSQTRGMANELAGVPAASAAARLRGLLDESGASELTLLGPGGRILGTTSAQPGQNAPDYPEEYVLLQAQQREFYAAAEPDPDTGLQVRVLATVPRRHALAESRILQAIYSLPKGFRTLADNVEAQYADYRRLSYLRQPLKYSFTLVLSLVLLVSVLLAVLAAFVAARRLVRPIRELSEATEAVAAGQYDRQLPVPARDELGFLVRSFNVMTRALARSSDAARRSQREVEAQRAYLEAVLERLSSGVVTLDGELALRTANATSGGILGAPLESYIGHRLAELRVDHPHLEPLIDAWSERMSAGEAEWREEVELLGSEGRQVLVCRGTRFSDAGGSVGHVVVFDDMTRLIQAQRDAAWGEVARRLAHEVKNPLTPIQLSAERLRHKYLRGMPDDDAQVLDRATHTIVQQVEALKTMVNAFGEYAQPPQLELEPVQVRDLAREVADLYEADSSSVAVRVQEAPDEPPVHADAGRLRQLLHNLIKNAREVAGDNSPCRVHLSTCVEEHAAREFLLIELRDNGPGFPEAMIDRLFEPYATTKDKGSGLGLAIVKQIVDEHGGYIRASNAADGGALIRIWLPIADAVGLNAGRQ